MEEEQDQLSWFRGFYGFKNVNLQEQIVKLTMDVFMEYFVLPLWEEGLYCLRAEHQPIKRRNLLVSRRSIQIV